MLSRSRQQARWLGPANESVNRPVKVPPTATTVASVGSVSRRLFTDIDNNAVLSAERSIVYERRLADAARVTGITRR